MARLTLLALVLAAMLAMLSLTSPAEAENSAAPFANEVLDHAPGALDDFGNILRFVNDGGDDDVDDDDDDEEDGNTRVVPLGLRSNDDDSDALLRRKAHARKARKHRQRTPKNKRKGVHHISALSGKKPWVKDCQITWYSKNDLKAPACGNGNWDPTPNNHIGAVMAGWKGGPACGEFVDLCRGTACVPVRIVDKCAGCGPDHVDLTKSAFRKLSPSGTLREGRIHGLKMYHYPKPNPWNLQLFGPFKLL